MFSFADIDSEALLDDINLYRGGGESGRNDLRQPQRNTVKILKTLEAELPDLYASLNHFLMYSLNRWILMEQVGLINLFPALP